MILEAIEQGQKLRQEHLHLEELGISTLTACFVNSNRDPKKGQPAKPSDFWYFHSQEVEVEVPSTAADAFFSLIADNLMPGWALGVLPIEQLRKAKRGLPVPSPRAIAGDGVLLLAPTQALVNGETKLNSGLAACEGGVAGEVPVTDLDSGTAFLIKMPSPERQWILNGEFDLMHY